MSTPQGKTERHRPPAGGARRAAAPPPLAQAGFTLIELMVVIAIIVALIAITVPSYQAMKAQNRRASCAANLKAIGQALALFREDYQCFPPDATEPLIVPNDLDNLEVAADPIHTLYDEAGQPIPTGVNGLGLYTLYYLGAYAGSLPPHSVEPRIGEASRASLPGQRKGLNGFLWFRGAGYLTELNTFHCPSNTVDLNSDYLRQRQDLLSNPQLPGVPYLGGWNGYDTHYRRNFWNPGTAVLPIVDYDTDGAPIYEQRHLLQPYPPADTAITWCPHHRRSSPPSGPGVPTQIRDGDHDMVLFADGSVRRMASQSANRMYEIPAPGSGWPEGPIM